MDLLQTLLEAQGGQWVGKLARNFGLGPSASQHSAALQQWVPMLAGGVQRNATQAGGLDSIISALQGANWVWSSRYCS